MTTPNRSSVEKGSPRRTFGERYDDISRRMDEAYAARRPLKYGTPEYQKADAAVEAVYANLRQLNAEVGA